MAVRSLTVTHWPRNTMFAHASLPLGKKYHIFLGYDGVMGCALARSSGQCILARFCRIFGARLGSTGRYPLLSRALRRTYRIGVLPHPTVALFAIIYGRLFYQWGQAIVNTPLGAPNILRAVLYPCEPDILVMKEMDPVGSKVTAVPH